MRNLIKKPWAFIRVSLYESYFFEVIGPGFLNQVPTLGSYIEKRYVTISIRAIVELSKPIVIIVTAQVYMNKQSIYLYIIYMYNPEAR